MAEEKTFVINDRRKFNKEGELREPSAISEASEPPAPKEEPKEKPVAAPEPVAESRPEEQLPPEPTAEEIAEVKAAFDQTAERLELAMRSNNLGGEFLPPMDFSRLVQSIYMTAMMQLGAGTPEGQKARVDLLGARQSIDMLRIVEEKSANNLTSEETRLLNNALFELRMGFLQITSALAQSAAAKMQSGEPNPNVAPPTGPKLVR